MGVLDLNSQLAFYKSYHSNHVNVTIHLFCIPVILLTALSLGVQHNLWGDSNPSINLGSATSLGYGLFYIALDPVFGIPTAAFMLTFTYFVKQYFLTLAAPDQTTFAHYLLVVHVVSWLAQFYGHGVHEKRAPALLDNLLQALVLAPYFVVYEVAFFLGFRKDLEKRMNNKAGVLIRNFRTKKEN